MIQSSYTHREDCFMVDKCKKRCPQCSTEFAVRPSRASRSKYCSMACYNLNKSSAIEERFWRYVDKAGPDECWVWTGAKAGEYGRVSVKGVGFGAHRISYEMAKGPIPPGFIILHSCDNPPCVNPSHLRVGTHTDNVHDMLEKGRGVVSDETKMKISAALTGRRLSDETRARQSAVARSRPPSRMALAVEATSRRVQFQGETFPSKAALSRHLGGVHSRVIERMIASGEVIECQQSTNNFNQPPSATP